MVEARSLHLCQLKGDKETGPVGRVLAQKSETSVAFWICLACSKQTGLLLQGRAKHCPTLFLLFSLLVVDCTSSNLRREAL